MNAMNSLLRGRGAVLPLLAVIAGFSAIPAPAAPSEPAWRFETGSCAMEDFYAWKAGGGTLTTDARAARMDEASAANIASRLSS